MIFQNYRASDELPKKERNVSQIYNRESKNANEDSDL